MARGCGRGVVTVCNGVSSSAITLARVYIAAPRAALTHSSAYQQRNNHQARNINNNARNIALIMTPYLFSRVISTIMRHQHAFVFNNNANVTINVSPLSWRNKRSVWHQAYWQ